MVRGTPHSAQTPALRPLTRVRGQISVIGSGVLRTVLSIEYSLYTILVSQPKPLTHIDGSHTQLSLALTSTHHPFLPHPPPISFTSDIPITLQRYTHPPPSLTHPPPPLPLSFTHHPLSHSRTISFHDQHPFSHPSTNPSVSLHTR